MKTSYPTPSHINTHWPYTALLKLFVCARVIQYVLSNPDNTRTPGTYLETVKETNRTFLSVNDVSRC